MTFGSFFNTRGVPDREAQARQVTQDFFEELQTAGLLYQGFRLGYDQAGRMIDPNLARRSDWNRVDQYQWAVFTGIQEPLFRPGSVVNLIPSYGNMSGTGMFDQSHVQWFLSGWNHEVYNHRTGRRDRYY